MSYLRDVKCPDLEKISKEFDNVEKRAKISVKDYLGKHALTSPLQTYTHSNYRYYGELNVDGKEHGRGIRIWNYGTIIIGYYENGRCAGNYIYIYSNGEFDVGEVYMKDGE